MGIEKIKQIEQYDPKQNIKISALLENTNIQQKYLMAKKVDFVDVPFKQVHFRTFCSKLHFQQLWQVHCDEHKDLKCKFFY